MPLPAPILDDRSYQQLRDELVRRIPVYTPEWTDHNPTDPGITLIELFAFLSENLLFRFNQIPESTKLAYLKLLDIPLRPAAASGGMLTIQTKDPGGTLVEQHSEVKAGAVPFETEDEVHVLPLECIAMAKLATREPETPEERAATELAKQARAPAAEDVQWAFYEAARVPADPARSDATPVDFRAAVDGAVWLAVMSTKHTDPEQLGGHVLNLGFIPEPEIASMDEIDACPGETDRAPTPAVLWQGSTGDVAERVEPVYRTLKVVGDTTRGLTQRGVVRIQLPDEITALDGVALDDPDLAGVGNFPPVLEDDEEATRVLFWLRASRIGDDQPIGRVRWFGVNATEVCQWRRARPEFVGMGNGQPSQTYALLHAPVIRGSLDLQVEEPEGWKTWTAVDGFEASGPDSREYVLDLEAGEVRFGNGVKGRPPQIGERIRAVEYRYGGGPQGNVAAKAVSKLTTYPGLTAANPLPTIGGAAGEPLAEALDRIPGELRRRDRAVTRDDFRELALQTPGALVGRAETIPLYRPRPRDLNAVGAVSVVVWPREDPKHPNAPMPDRALLRQVCTWLDARRLITTEVWVIPPVYRRIALAVGIAIKPGYGVEAVRRWVELVLRQYLAPLPPYGPEGAGWPLGRRVHGPELEAAALQVEGVAFLEDDLRVAAWDGEGEWVESGNVVQLEPWEVPELWEITVVEGTPLTPGTVQPAVPPTPPKEPPPLAVPFPPPADTGTVPGGPVPAAPPTVSVPLPVPREVC